LIFTETQCGPPIAFYKSTQISGFDIYIWESLREKGKDKILFVSSFAAVISAIVFSSI
jgi:hypothetical protein